MRQELLENRIEVYDCTADDNDLSQGEKEKIKVHNMVDVYETTHNRLTTFLTPRRCYLTQW